MQLIETKTCNSDIAALPVINSYFATREEYLKFRAAWKVLAQKKELTSTHMLLFNLLLGRDEKKGFTPITNSNKLNCNCNGDPWYNFNLIKSSARWKLGRPNNSYCLSLSLEPQMNNDLLKRLL